MATYKNVTLRQRRDNDYNYAKVQDTFIPAKGEIVLVDTAHNGLRSKIGDGISTYAELDYVDKDIAANIVIRGYLEDNVFYSNGIAVIPTAHQLFIDNKGIIYIYNTEEGLYQSVTAVTASAEQAGIVKLYSSTGDNIDGTMTQKAITEALSEKVSISADSENELLTFIK